MFVVTLVLLSCTILVFFSQEFAASFKKLFALPGVRLLLPLIVVTALIVYYDAWALWTLLKAKETLRNFAVFLAKMVPFQNAFLFSNMLVLFSLPVLFLIAKRLGAKKSPLYSYQFYYFSVAILWVLALILLVVDMHHLN